MPELPVNVLRYGSEAELPVQRVLRAGPLTVVLERCDLRYVRLGEREIVRRVYVAVRDETWDTIVGEVHDLAVETGTDSFAVTFACVHRRGPIDFVWRGRIVGDAQGTITYSMDGEAGSTFRRNRIGICVLHPIEECAGQPFVLTKVDGIREEGTFPRDIAPHQPAMDFQEISYAVEPGVRAEIQFSGEVFEMEDQRNWTDASFKTYSTPLRLPMPVEVPAGSRIRQSVTVRLQSDRPIASSPDSPDATFDLGKVSSRHPSLGLSLASQSPPLAPREVERLRALKLSHLRVDLSLDAPDLASRLGRATDESRALGVALEVALFLTDNAEPELATLRALLDEQRPAVASFLIFHVNEKVTASHWVSLAREYLGTYAATARLGSGTNNYFTELNRERPATEGLDLVCYSLNPQVHAFDNQSLVETLPGQGWTVASARKFLGDVPLAITPVTLKPRFNPSASGAELALASDGLPPAVDPRQQSLFGAAWTVGSLKYLAEAGIASITYYEITGWRGVLETEAGSAFPVYHVLADVAEFAGANVVTSVSSDPLRFDGLAIRTGERTRVLLASLSPAPQRVTLRGLRGPVRTRSLDETTAPRAMEAPEAFRSEPWSGQELDGDSNLAITLLPYAVVTIDATGQP